MKKIIIVFFIALSFLILVLTLKTLSFKSKQFYVKPVKDLKINKEKIAKHLGAALKFKTISNENKQSSRPEFLALHKYLENTFPLVHKKMTKKILGNYSLLYEIKGQNKNLKPMLLMAHLDVVPVEKGTENKWEYPPFSGKIAKGFIWGRGAMDDKLSVLGILEAMEFLLSQNFIPKRTIYFAFGEDEEIGGENGAEKIVNFLQKNKVKLIYVLDEGMVIINKGLPGLNSPVAMIALGEKGYASVELKVEVKGGHSSTPSSQTTIGMLADAISKLEKNQMPARITAPIKQMFNYVGAELSFPPKIIFANLWLTSGILKYLLVKASPATAAIMRTTTAPTIFKAGVKDNVLPTKGFAIINFRILPGDNLQSVIKHIKKVVHNPYLKIKVKAGANNPSPISGINTFGFKAITRTIKEIFPETIVAPSLIVAGTDSLHYLKLTKNIYRFLPLEAVQDDLERIHGTNERLAVENYEKIVKFYIQLIKNSN